jgi:hypothetical protein
MGRGGDNRADAPQSDYDLIVCEHQDLHKFSLKTPYIRAKGIRLHPRVVPVGKS